VTILNDEGRPIARLSAADNGRTVGWVYSWDYSGLSILWINERYGDELLGLKIGLKMLNSAENITLGEVQDLLDKRLNSIP